jgi:predicted NAD-dependent protein-ADP-ribosyltransferase YbiA (DUF1768 family)
MNLFLLLDDQQTQQIINQVTQTISKDKIKQDQLIYFNDGLHSKYDMFSSFDTTYPFSYTMMFNQYVVLTIPAREYGFQALKATNEKDERYVLSSSSCQEAKRRGTNIQLRPDWDNVRRLFMYELCLRQVMQHQEMLKLLLSTGHAELIDSGIEHRDHFWADYQDGENWHGKIWMMIRDNLRKLSE